MSWGTIDAGDIAGKAIDAARFAAEPSAVGSSRASSASSFDRPHPDRADRMDTCRAGSGSPRDLGQPVRSRPLAAFGEQIGSGGAMDRARPRPPRQAARCSPALTMA